MDWRIISPMFQIPRALPSAVAQTWIILFLVSSRSSPEREMRIKWPLVPESENCRANATATDRPKPRLAPDIRQQAFDPDSYIVLSSKNTERAIFEKWRRPWVPIYVTELSSRAAARSSGKLDPRVFCLLPFCFPRPACGLRLIREYVVRSIYLHLGKHEIFSVFHC